jgi:hypothetical protein
LAEVECDVAPTPADLTSFCHGLMVKWRSLPIPAVFIVGFILGGVLVSLAIMLGAFGILTTLGLR